VNVLSQTSATKCNWVVTFTQLIFHSTVRERAFGGSFAARRHCVPQIRLRRIAKRAEREKFSPLNL
jgi:hypothetical protein